MKDIVKRATSIKAQSVKCPNCKKRAFDIHKDGGESVIIELKCPHCHQIVNIKVDNKN